MATARGRRPRRAATELLKAERIAGDGRALEQSKLGQQLGRLRRLVDRFKRHVMRDDAAGGGDGSGGDGSGGEQYLATLQTLAEDAQAHMARFQNQQRVAYDELADDEAAAPPPPACRRSARTGSPSRSRGRSPPRRGRGWP